MKVAFYKGTHKGLPGIYNRLVRFIETGLYSHCELVFSDGYSASSSFMDGGVRIKYIAYDNNWDFIEISNNKEEIAKKWFLEHLGQKYDLLGNLRFFFGLVRQEKKQWFCSESIAESLGLIDSYRYEPNILYSALSFKE